MKPHNKKITQETRLAAIVPKARWIAIGLLVCACLFTAHADTLTWDPGHTGYSGGAGTWDFNTTANWLAYFGFDVKWTDNSANGTNGAVFTATGGTVTLNTNLSASNLQFFGTDYTLSGSGTLTLGAGGIDASYLTSGTTTIGNALALSGGQQLWQVGSGGVLAVNGTISRSVGATVDFSPAGVTTTSASLTNDATGIIGGWATIGAFNSFTNVDKGDWAANNGSGSIVAYAGYTVQSAAASSSPSLTGSATQNWLCGALNGTNYVTTVTASAILNSLVMQGDVTLNSGVTLTLGSGGLIMKGDSSRWMLAGDTNTTFLTSGASSGRLDVYVPGIGLGNWTIWPIIADNRATPVTLVKNGVGELKLRNINNYTGGTIVNSGYLAARGNDSYGQGVNTVGIITPFGTGGVAVNNSALLLGSDVDNGSSRNNAFLEMDVTNPITLNNGQNFEVDGFWHCKGTLAISSGGGVLGATYNGSSDALVNGFAKGLFIDGLLTGSGPLTIKFSQFDSTHNYDCSTVYFTSPGTAAQNTYSGTVTVDPYDQGRGAQGGTYLYLIGTNALANATINLWGDNSATAGRFGAPSLLFGSGTNLDGVGYATIGGLTGSGSVVLANTLTAQNGTATLAHSYGAPFALSVGNNNTSSTYSGAMSGAGSLTKIGTGTFTLSGSETYTGATTVSAGTLELVNPDLNTNSTVTVAGGAVLQLDFAVTNQVASFVTNGMAAGPGVYNATTGAPFITGTGSLLVPSAVVTPPPAYLTNSVSGSVLTLSWPAGQSWRLEMQTNSLAKGLGTNWVDITPGSATTTNITVLPSVPTVYYRLTYP